MAGGAFAGGATGGIAGKALAERLKPRHEDEYWRNEFPRRPYAMSSRFGWDDYWPAYRFGYERFPLYGSRGFGEVEPELAAEWQEARGRSRLEWDEARNAARDAYERLKSRQAQEQ